MKDELARKRPAQIIHAEPLTLPRTEVLPPVGLHQKADLMRRLRTMVDRGEIGPTYAVERTRTGWAVKVVRIKEGPNWWQRNGLRASLWAAGLLGFLTAAVILVRMLVTALAALLPIAVGLVLLMLVVAGLSMLSGGGSVEVLQRVRIKRW
jgi:hypothetical protein